MGLVGRFLACRREKILWLWPRCIKVLFQWRGILFLPQVCWHSCIDQRIDVRFVNNVLAIYQCLETFCSIPFGCNYVSRRVSNVFKNGLYIKLLEQVSFGL